MGNQNNHLLFYFIFQMQRPMVDHLFAVYVNSRHVSPGKLLLCFKLKSSIANVMVMHILVYASNESNQNIHSKTF